MASPVHKREQTGVGITASIPIKDTTDLKVAYMVKVLEGSVTYTVEHSLDDINFIRNSDAENQTGDIDGNYILPIRSVRLNVTSGTGKAVLIVRQLIF